MSAGSACKASLIILPKILPMISLEGADIELLRDVVAVRLDRLGADLESAGNALAAFPHKTSSRISRSRGVSIASPCASCRLLSRFSRASTSRLSAVLTRSRNCWLLNGFCRKSTAPDCMARTTMGTSPCADRKMMGIEIRDWHSCSINSSPFISGIRTSSTRHPGLSGRYAFKKARADGNVRTFRPMEPISRPATGAGTRRRRQRKRSHSACSWPDLADRQRERDLAPWGRLCAAFNLPSCDSIMVRQIESPSPSPSGLVVT